MGLSDGKQRGAEVPEEGGGARLPGFAIMVSQRFNMNMIMMLTWSVNDSIKIMHDLVQNSKANHPVWFGEV